MLSPPAVAGGAWTESMLYVFKGGDDGQFPLGALTMVGGVLYGATLEGGARDLGTVFALAPPTKAGGSWTKSLVYSFNGGSDGAKPHGSLINVGGTLYGATHIGGANHAGTIFASGAAYNCRWELDRDPGLLFRRRQRWRRPRR